ncbi:RNA-directed DNA polymerase [Methanoplanus sp. FWC-SCC4]|uniref:RNA-directed DNA polymerase n=1 Tax=Methanochimaera problematica TaxID=2609417 RepID=A0AA97FFJ2_9EURY|nr:RNA-directed DNA polymerase [Methanoplanus sp. FWC-SCC4]WOF17254.1 RNA-directed DNA polymerase [Methanoplanus sp. FWC-SCC4]
MKSTPNLNIDALIRKGYFPDVLPPQFKTSKLADILPENLKSICQLKNKGPYKKEFCSSKCCLHSIPKLKVQRRVMSIPNPFHQIILCNYLEIFWDDINEHFAKSQISLSTPIPDPESKRSFKRNISFRERTIKGILESNDARYCLCTDISRFYPTIYTHTIPWALHGKSVSKQNRHCKKEYYGNCIDKSVRNTKDQQTSGIPVGPDSSHIISEIICTQIDIQLEELLNKNLKGFRCVDDICLFFRERSEAEHALHELHRILHEYELEINPTKTKIVELPRKLQKEWPSEIRLYEFRISHNKGDNHSKKQETDLIDYFSIAFQKAIQHPNDSILKYSLKRINDQEILPENWKLYESLILKSIVAEPMCIPDAIRILHTYSKKPGYQLDADKISATVSEMLLHHCKFSHGYELAWILWLAKVFNITIKNQNVLDSLSKCNDVIVVLTVLDLRKIGLIKGNLDTTEWINFMKKDELYSDHWLIAYEAYVNDWLNPEDNGQYIKDDSFFKILYENNVRFYDSSINKNFYETFISSSVSEY